MEDFKTKVQTENYPIQQSTDSTTHKAAKIAKKIDVIVNVGIINEKERILKIVRGSKLPISINRQADAQGILKAALEKHASHDQYFCQLEDWPLVHPAKKNLIGFQEQI